MSVTVSTISYAKLIQDFQLVSIPDYQRPYRWASDKVEELLEDLNEFFLINEQIEGLDYYIGGILFYYNQDQNTYEIIDGQQRLTTLHLLYYTINDLFEDGQDLHYNNHISFYHIKKNLDFLEGKKGLLEKLNNADFFNSLTFTLIISTSEDNAFAFFDSQNNRGVSLAADDYLKAFHLREVVEPLQRDLAEHWEKAAIKAQKEENVEKGLLHLFYMILYRARTWKGQSELLPENKESVLNTFQKNTKKSRDINFYPLYSASSNLKYTNVSIDETGDRKLVSNEKVIQSDTELPFSLRQPIARGHNFFQFTEKYYSIHQLLFHQSQEVSEVLQSTRNYYTKVYNSNMSEYLRHFMQLCLVLYYDVFGEYRLDKAIAYFDYFIGSLRIHKYYVRQEAIKNILMDSSNNLLDVIAHAYEPDEVFDFIISQSSIRKVYVEERLDESKNGVKEKYKQRVLTQFNQEGHFSLKNRLEWIG